MLAVALTAAAAAPVFDLTIDKGKLRGGRDVIRVHQGDHVVLRWRSDRAATIHLHGYEIETRLVPGTTVEMHFEARAAGRFPIHVHAGSGQGETLLAYLEVYPD